MTPVVDALIAAMVRRGDAVLDVACWTGFATRAAAAVAGPGARVEGTDVNPAMVAQARVIANDSEANVGWAEASGLDLPFSDNNFDAVICQQGLKFSPDPAAGVREMKRVAEPGGRETQLRSWLIAGGFDDVDVELVEVDVELPPLSRYVRRHLSLNPPK